MSVVFWFVVAAMLGVALAFLLPPLLRRGAARARRPSSVDHNVALFRERLADLDAERAAGELDDDGYAQAREELERELLQDTEGGERKPTATGARSPWLAGGLALGIPAVAVGLYLWLGNSAALNPASYVAPKPGDAHSIEQMVTRLATRLKSQPNDAEGWMMLGRSYTALGRFSKASEAFSRAHKLIGDQPDLLTAWAEADAMAHGDNLTGRPTELINRALKIAPNDQRALWLGGFSAMNAGKRALAISRWRDLLAQMPPGSKSAKVLGTLIDRAKGEKPATETAGGTAGSAKAAAPAPAQGVSPQTATGGGPRIEVSVSLDPALANKVAGDDTVYVFARAPQGPRMPLAVVRRHVSDLPFTVTLSDASAMTPQLNISRFPQVVVTARISKSGRPIASSGDLEGDGGEVKVASDPDVKITINRVLP